MSWEVEMTEELGMFLELPDLLRQRAEMLERWARSVETEPNGEHAQWIRGVLKESAHPDAHRAFADRLEAEEGVQIADVEAHYRVWLSDANGKELGQMTLIGGTLAPDRLDEVLQMGDPPSAVEDVYVAE